MNSYQKARILLGVCAFAALFLTSLLFLVTFDHILRCLVHVVDNPNALDTEHWTLDTDYWTSGTGHWAWNTGHWARDMGHWPMGTEHWTLNTGLDTLEVIAYNRK